MNDADIAATLDPEFQQRCVELFNRVEAGEKIAVTDCAAFLGLSLAGFLECWEGYATTIAAAAAARKGQVH